MHTNLRMSFSCAGPPCRAGPTLRVGQSRTQALVRKGQSRRTQARAVIDVTQDTFEKEVLQVRGCVLRHEKQNTLVGVTTNGHWVVHEHEREAHNHRSTELIIKFRKACCINRVQSLPLCDSGCCTPQTASYITHRGTCCSASSCKRLHLDWPVHSFA